MATGQTCAYGVSVHERATEFTVDPGQFLVMASRTREFTVMIMPAQQMRSRGGREVQAFLELVKNLGWTTGLGRVGLQGDVESLLDGFMERLGERYMSEANWRREV